MTKEEIISKVKSLNLPKGSYVVWESAPLTVAGIREANDIDLLVSTELFTELKKRGWKEHQKSPTDIPIVYQDFEAHDSWQFSPYNPSLEELLSRAVEVEGVRFASLEEDVKKWKKSAARAKDLEDIRLIERHAQS